MKAFFSIAGSACLLILPLLVFAAWHEEEFHEGGSTIPLRIWVITVIFILTFFLELAVKLSRLITKKRQKPLPEIDLDAEPRGIPGSSRVLIEGGSMRIRKVPSKSSEEDTR
ncbi:hypothetical protein N9F36_03305 [Akkermansiaceae bacterium]|nr:hypothetical protein [Akkermansiaceae bacterium]